MARLLGIIASMHVMPGPVSSPTEDVMGDHDGNEYADHDGNSYAFHS